MLAVRTCRERDTDWHPPWLNCCSSCSPRRSRRACRGGRRRICKRLVTEGLKAQGLEVGRGARLRDAAAADAGGGGRAGEVAGGLRGAQGAARRRAGAGDRGLPQVGGARVDQGRRDRQGREEGRLLRREDREAGPRGEGDRRRGGAGVVAKFPWPKSMRWGSGTVPVGAAAAFDRLPARRQGRAVRDRGRRGGNATRGHRFHGNEPFEVEGLRGLRQEARGAQGDAGRRRARGA